ncbi:MAG TPA: tetronasin resistance protein [Tetragenococcus sp.]|nr:tetronasin resistance protein [Tetragenococcus sp.]
MKEKFSGWFVLLIQYLKGDRKKILFWTLGLTLFCGGFVPAFEEIAKGKGLVGMYETLKNPAMISLVGPTPAKEAADYTLGAMYVHEMLLFCGLFAMILSGLHIISHTRKDEELGVTELLRSFQVGRQASSLAVFVETILINLLMVFMIAGLMFSFSVKGLDTQGILLYSFSIGAAGIMGAGMALIFAQIMTTSSGAISGLLSLLGLLYILRAGTDTSAVDLSYLNPMSWIYLTYPFTENNWNVLLYAAVFLVGCFITAAILENYRDLATGYFSERRGQARAGRTLLSVPGLLFRVNRTTIVSWLIGYLILGATYGSIYGDMGTFLSSNQLVEQMFANAGVSLEKSFTTSIMMVMILLAIILPIVVVNKLFNEEVHGRLSQFYVTDITRARLYGWVFLFAVFFGGLSILFAAGALGATAIFVTDGKAGLSFSDFLTAGINYFPALLFFIGMSTCFLGWLPKLGKLVYAYLSYTFVLSYFGNILDFPDWFNKTSILSWIPAMPTDQFELRVFLLLTLFGLLLCLLGLLGYRHRDFIENI